MNQDSLVIEINEPTEKFPDLPLKKYASLPEKSSRDDDEPSLHDSSNILSHKICLTNLLKMGFDIKVCFKILETSPITESSPEIFLQIIMEKYYIQNQEGKNQIKNHGSPQKKESLLPLDLNIFFDVSRSLKKKIQAKKKAATTINPIVSDLYVEIHNESQSNLSPKKDDPIMIASPLPEFDLKEPEKLPDVGMIDSQKGEPIIQNSLSESEMKGPTKLCLICYETKEESQFQSLLSCPDIFCKNCLSDYLSNLIKSAKLIKIPCPANCGAELSDLDIETIFKDSPQLISRLKKVRAALITDLDPLNRWCTNPICNTVIRNNAMAKKIKCQNCGNEMCFDCRGAWHGKMSCEQALDKEIKVYSKQKNVKLCPKCKSRIEKNEGCNHMTCSRCNYQFCWLCGGHYTSSHFDISTASNPNPWGCPGMQNLENEAEYRRFKYCRIIKRACKITAFIFLPIAFLLFWIIFSFLLIPWVYSAYNEPKNKKDYVKLVAIGLLGIPFVPICMILIVAPGSCLLYREYKKRKEQK